MKKFSLIYYILGLSILVLSCSSDDATPNQIENETVRGAIVRTVERSLANVDLDFDINDLSSTISVELEEQDEENGGLLEDLDIYVQKQVLNENAVYVNSGSEVLFQTIPASEFSLGPLGLPRTVFTAIFQDVLTALDLGDDYQGGDRFRFRLVLNLTDGRSYTDSDMSSSVTQSFFRSPMVYFGLIACPYSDSIFNGDYEVVQDSWADYAPGDIVPVTASGNEIRILSTNNPFLLNPDTSYMILTVSDGGVVEVTSNELFDYGGTLQLDVTGEGTVNPCDGSIDIIIDFGTFTGNTFKLKKA